MVVALANKMAREIRAMLMRHESYRGLEFTGARSGIQKLRGQRIVRKAESKWENTQTIRVTQTRNGLGVSSSL
jgi:hypothetical protein